MRKNIFVGNNLDIPVRTVYEIKGLNLDRFINTCGKRGLVLFDVKKYTNKRLRFCVKHNDRKKLFAITDEMCYNIKKVKDKGRGYPLLYFYRNVGVLLGIALFIAVAAFADDLVFSLSFTGSGSVYSREVANYLAGRGVGVCSRFSALDLDLLGDEIMAMSPRLSFAECRKDGNRLAVELVLSEEPPKALSGTAVELKSDVSGIVEEIKVYRGTAEVKAGDAVSAGDILVGGYSVVNERRIELNVVATVTVRTERRYEYRSNNDNEEEIALLFAEQIYHESSVSDYAVIKTQSGDEFIYTVTMVSRRILFAG